MINTSQLTRIAIVTFLILGCFLVLQPFMAAILFSAVVCIFSWPLYQRIWLRLGQRDTLAALVMTLLLLVALIVPMASLAANLADAAAAVIAQLQLALQHPDPQAPQWLRDMPLIGEPINDFWHRIALSREELMKSLQQFYEPIRKFGLNAAQLLGGGLLQLILVVFVAFFFYRDGERLADAVKAIAVKIGGALGLEMLVLSSNTAKAVMLGIFGTAAVQAVVALIGFLIAGIPLPLLLASAIFFLSVVPVGPPLVWGGAAVWLYNHGEHGWAIFMAVYGLLVISSVDNVVKPMLISQSVNLPFLLALIGVLGGALAFGFVGIFLGPTLLAVGLTLMQHWIAVRDKKAGELF